MYIAKEGCAEIQHNGNSSIFPNKFINYINSLCFNSGKIFNIIFSRWEQRQHTAMLIASLDRVSTNNWLLRANGYCFFLDRWIADSSSWIFQNSSFLDSWSLILDSRLSILNSRFSCLATQTSQPSRRENGVSRIELRLSTYLWAVLYV